MATAALTKQAQVAGSTRQKQSTDLWSTIFPNQQKTRTQSAVLMKKLLAVSVSNIAYLRALLPESAFSERKLGAGALAGGPASIDSPALKNATTNLKILRDDSPAASQLIQWLKGSFDAMDRSYLKTFIMAVCTDPNSFDSALETYSFEFAYNHAAIQNECSDSNAPSSFTMFHNRHGSNHTSSNMGFNANTINDMRSNFSLCTNQEDVRNSTIRLLRTLIVLTQAVDSLPTDRPLYLCVRLLYHDAITPEAYEPEGFGVSNEGHFKHNFETVTIKAGEVNTNFHSVKCRVVTDKQMFEEGDDEHNGESDAKIRNQNSCIMPNHQDPYDEIYLEALNSMCAVKSFSIKSLSGDLGIDSENSKKIIDRAKSECLIRPAKKNGYYAANQTAIQNFRKKFEKNLECSNVKSPAAKKPHLDDFEISNSQPSYVNFSKKSKLAPQAKS